MPQSEEAAAWFYAVYTAVQQVPHGKVTSYGHIARLLGRHAAKQPNNPFNSNTVPWQRIINSRGSISPRYVILGAPAISVIQFKCHRGPNGASRQASALRREDVVVERGAMGELTIDLGAFGWFPDMLPSEAAEIEAASDESDDADEE
ncbi:hypothetical protein ANO11243_021620 [Dothideomycetidae sp. 11243]|nr:hypothetical protein ANO11243_021620 [fungal sp. No.11243]